MEEALDHADVLPVVFFADKQAPLHVLRFAARLDHIPARIVFDMVDRLVKRLEFFILQNVDSCLFQFFLAERAIVFQAVGIRGAADHFFALRS